PKGCTAGSGRGPLEKDLHHRNLASGLPVLLHGSLRDRLFQVRTTLRPKTLRIEVSDPRGERLPSLRVAEDDECFGRGLHIVTQLADRWGTQPRSVGKTVYAEIDVRTDAAR
ncbi:MULTISPECIES: ATP-binding protein, partial [unclassified Streptomyces]|uniref:ATP-binding protein n=1 Tax=unclassified Streptomyces TaxID=2593676 RepID=UPI003442377B